MEKTNFDALVSLEKLSHQKHIANHLNPKSLSNFQEEFFQKEITFLSIFSTTNTLAGYLILKQTDKSLQLKRIVIDERHLGMGKKVMQELEVYVLKNYEAQEIWLDVYADNKRAITLYENLGYRRYNTGIENNREVWFYKKSLLQSKII